MTAPEHGPAPLAGGAQEELVHERASATPMRPSSTEMREVPLGSKNLAGAPLALSLRDAQSWFKTVVTHPENVQAGVAAGNRDVDRVITPGPRMSAMQRLGTYHYAYWARLIECLADDFPVVRYAIGEHAFDELCRAYIATHPSSHPSLNFFGKHMPSFLRTFETTSFSASFAANLASLEWAMVEVIHAPTAAVLTLDALAAVPVARWGEARLPPSEAARLLRFNYPVNAYLQAFREGGVPEVPAPLPSATAIYRRGLSIWRMDLTPPMARVLGALFDGATLGAALSTIEREGDDDATAEAARDVMKWFQEWVSGGIFAGIDVE